MKTATYVKTRSTAHCAMSIPGHVTHNVFIRYNITRDEVQTAALERQAQHLASQRGTTSTTPSIGTS